MAWLTRFFEGLFLLFTGTLVIYLIRNFLPWGCVVGMALCLVALYLIGRFSAAAKTGKARTVTGTASVQMGGVSLVAKVTRGATGPIGDAVRMSLGHSASDSIKISDHVHRGPIGPTGPPSEEDKK
jgi:hypothetical protein